LLGTKGYVVVVVVDCIKQVTCKCHQLHGLLEENAGHTALPKSLRFMDYKKFGTLTELSRSPFVP
jgi:hypothetical protein